MPIGRKKCNSEKRLVAIYRRQPTSNRGFGDLLHVLRELQELRAAHLRLHAGALRRAQLRQVLCAGEMRMPLLGFLVANSGYYCEAICEPARRHRCQGRLVFC